MSGKRYTEEFKIAALKHVVDRGHPAAEVAERLGISVHSIYAWTNVMACQRSSARPMMPRPTRCDD